MQGISAQLFLLLTSEFNWPVVLPRRSHRLAIRLKARSELRLLAVEVSQVRDYPCSEPISPLAHKYKRLSDSLLNPRAAARCQRFAVGTESYAVDGAENRTSLFVLMAG